MQGPNFALLSPSTDIQVADNITWIKGNHTLKAGVVVIRDRVDQNGRANYTGTANFQPASGNCRATTANTVLWLVRRVSRKLQQLLRSKRRSHGPLPLHPTRSIRCRFMEDYPQA